MIITATSATGHETIISIPEDRVRITRQSIGYGVLPGLPEHIIVEAVNISLAKVCSKLRDIPCDDCMDKKTCFKYQHNEYIGI